MKKISIYRPSTVDEAIQILSQHGTSAVGLRRRHGPADPPEEPPGAGAQLSGRHQEDRPPPLYQGRRAGRRRNRRGHEAGGDRRFQALAGQSIRCWWRPSTRSPRRNCATHPRSAATCCRKYGASICAAAIRAGETADTCATAPSATTATITRPWADACATPSIPATPPPR